MPIKSLFQLSLYGKARTIKYFSVTVILQQGFALHHFPFAMCFFRLHKRLPWQKGAASWPDLAKGLTKVFSSTQLMPVKLSIQRKVIVLTLFFSSEFITPGPLPI